MHKKIAIVTGASKGIGCAIAKRLVSDGFSVVGTYVSNYTETEIEAITEGLFTLKKVDGRDFEDCQNFIAEVIETYGQIDVLVNNAGIVKDHLMMRMSHDDFVDVLDANLVSAFNMTKHASKSMLRKRSGAIVNISSVIGLIGNAGQANYAASKAGLIGFSKSNAKEFAARNVRVNVVAPGFIETNMTDSLSAEQSGTILEQVALKRFGRVEDIAHAVSFLVSEDSSYITGQVLSVCGGMVI